MKRQTSADVYHRIESEGLLSRRRFQVYSALFKHGPLTQMETTRLIPNTLEHSVSPRFAELENMGVVKTVGERICKITGRNVLIWDVTDNLPVEIKKPTKIKCKHCNGKGHFIQERML